MDVLITEVVFILSFVALTEAATATPATSGCPLVPVPGDHKMFTITIAIGSQQHSFVVPCYGTEVFDQALCQCAEPSGTTSGSLTTPPPPPTTTTVFLCPFYADPNNPHYFKQFSINRNQFYTYQCDNGKIFHAATCRCVYAVPQTTAPPTTTVPTVPSTFPLGATTSATCNRVAAASPNQFYEEKDGVISLEDCLTGSFFDSTLCVCVLSADRQQPKCVPELHLDFRGNFQDVSGNNIYVTNVNLPNPSSGVAQFDGKGYLQVWLYQNAPLGNSLTVELKFQESPVSKNIETLVANCYYDVGSSVEIAVDPVAKHVLFIVLPMGFAKQVVNVTYTQTNVPKSAVLYYDGRTLTGEVDGISQSVTFANSTDNLKADLYVTYGDLSVGTCKTFRTFTGKMTDLALYKCDKRQWM